MARKRHTGEDIIGKLRTAEIELAKGVSAAEVIRKLGITERTNDRWRKEYGSKPWLVLRSGVWVAHFDPTKVRPVMAPS